MNIKTKKTLAKIARVTLRILVPILVVLAIYIFTQLIAAFLINVYPVFKHWNSQQASTWINNSVVAQFWVTVIIEGLTLLILKYYLKRRHQSFKDIGLRGRVQLMDLAYSLAGFAAYFTTFYVVLTAVTHAVPSFNSSQKQDIGFSSTTAGGDLWLVFISLVILPPIVEEILFRGYLYTNLRERIPKSSKYPKIIAAIITSAVFASFHLLESSSGLLWIAGLDTFILSLVLVYLREKTGKLYASMGLHMIKNLIAFSSLFLFHLS